MSEEESKYVFRPYAVERVDHTSDICPRPRSGHRIVCDEQYFYCYGGYNPSLPDSTVHGPDTPLFGEFWVFSLAKKTWKICKVENMPKELASAACVLYRNNVLIFGGTGLPFGDKCNRNLMIWHVSKRLLPESTFYIPETTGVIPPGLYGQTILVHDEYLYTIGGTNGFSFNCDIYRLNLRNLEWEELYVSKGTTYEPPGRYRHEVAIHENKLYVLGGGTAFSAFPVQMIPIFDFKARQWTLECSKGNSNFKPEKVPYPRKCHSVVQIRTPDGDTHAYIAGGNGLTIYDCVWRLSLRRLEWTLMTKSVLPKPIYFHSATVNPHGCMYIFGGIERRDNERTRNNNVLKMWLCIPRLSEIAWEALLYYCPKISQMSRKKLLVSGIPDSFLVRLHDDCSDV